MSLWGDWNASLDQLKDRVGEWVTQGSGMLASMGAGQKNRERGARSWDDSQENEAGASREDFASRVQEVHMHLNLSVRPILISGGANFSIAKDILREAYADEPVFRWLLGNVNPKKDPASYQQKKDLLLDWMVDWRVSSCQSFSHCLAIPTASAQVSPGTSPPELRGCALVTSPASKTEMHSFMSLLAYGASPAKPPAALGTACASRFAALDAMCRARDRLASASPHWYVHMLGISPKHQGKGMGRMLMRIISALADQDAYPVHLEVSGSRNRAYFEQCGFRTMETIDVCSEDSPTLKICMMTRVPFPKLIELE